jgi:hypothetical protein
MSEGFGVVTIAHVVMLAAFDFVVEVSRADRAYAGRAR